ncbi:condensation domain-containing protein [Roseobacter sp.]|uniref:condensation domain-containing protein n=1 Tax=Roseobacter sp. TaxID=1907202 RepID=UPI00329914FA
MTDTTPDTTAKKRNIETILPLTPLQEGILFHTLLAQDRGLYMPQMAYFLSGPIDPDQLRAAWAQVLARHSALRSGIHWEERADPFQIIYRQLPLNWEHLDWRGQDTDTALNAVFEQNRRRPFDLRRPPLMRLQMAQTGPEQHVLVLCHHHIVLDGWSTARMLQDVMAFYHGLGGALPVARPYADYIRWMKRQDRTASRAFWQDLIAGTPGPSLAFGQDSDTPEFDRQSWPFPDDLADAVTQFCAHQGITLNTLLQGALGLFVAQKLGRSDVFFGAATSGRPANLPGAADMVGLFINALPVRIKVAPTDPVDVWLDRLQRQQAATIEHEHIALRDIQDGLGTLFDCLLVVENYPVTIGSGQSDIALDRVEFDEWTHFPLTLLVAPGHAGMKLILRRDRHVLDDAALAEFIDRYVAIMRQIIENPQAPLSDITGPLRDLPAAQTARPAAVAAGARMPTTPTEQTIAEIWSDVLQTAPPKAQDNFFAIGGHSLLAAKVVTRLRRAFDIDLPVRVMFDTPVLADMATYLDARQAAAAPTQGANVMEF